MKSRYPPSLPPGSRRLLFRLGSRSRDRRSNVPSNVKMAAFMVRFAEAEDLHFNQIFLSIYTNTCPSYEYLTTPLINLTMEGTLSEINNQLCRPVNKGVLRAVHQYPRDKATAARKLTSCLYRQSCVHKIEIIRDKTAR